MGQMKSMVEKKRTLLVASDEVLGVARGVIWAEAIIELFSGQGLR
jgi:hypothetical protein